MSEIARSMGVSVPSLRQRFPDETASLASLHVKRGKRVLARRYTAQEAALRKAVATLVGEGTYPSAKRSFELAGLKSALGNVRLKAIWRDAQHREGVQPY